VIYEVTVWELFVLCSKAMMVMTTMCLAWLMLFSPAIYIDWRNRRDEKEEGAK
jgi:hypothetical protein